jgi:membrane-associated protease RseP (regulator of RpoE activity)
MRKYILTTIAMLPLLFTGSEAAQRWTGDAPQPVTIISEDSDSGGYLGVEAVDITPERLGALKLKEEKGVEVTMVDQDAPASKAGIKEHDVILTFNGTSVESKSQLHRIVRETPAGRVVTLGISRDGQPMTIKVQLADNTKEWTTDRSFNFQIPNIPKIPPIPNLPDFDIPNIGVVYVHSSMRSGLMVENLTPQLRDFFGAKNGNGILVRSVEKGSRAEKAGVHAGDVIVRVGDQPVHDTSDFTHALHGHGSGSVGLSVIRDKREQTLTLTLPEQKDSGAVIEEGLEAPELDSETRDQLRELRDELAKLQPQMELAKEEAMKSVAEFEKAGREQQKVIKEQGEKVKNEVGEKALREVQKQMERLRRQMQGDLLDI